MPRKQRVTLEQRRALRTWVRSQHHRPSQRACIAWFQQQFNHQLSQSTVSESLSDRFSTLDGIDRVEDSRIRLGQWPDLGNLLVLWQKRIEEQGGFTSGDLICEKARQVWHQLL